MTGVLRFFQVIYSVYAFLLFVIVMLLCFPFILLASLAGKRKGGNIIYKICNCWADICLFCWGIRHKNIGREKYDLEKPAIYVFNHISYMDIPLLLKSLKGINIRVLGKEEMSKIPIFGFIYRNAAVTVNRSSAQNRIKSVEALTTVIKNNISVVIAPEGTFNTTGEPLKTFYDGAFRIAIETHTPIRPFILLDAYDRLNYKSIFTLTPGKSRAVFLEEIPATHPAFADVATLKQKVYRQMENEIIQGNATWVKKS